MNKQEVNKKRYPGVTPFSTEQSHIFFGRNQEITSLLELIVQEKLVVLYGKSGLGKSSLLNAGIIPQIKDKNLYHPIIIRFGAQSKDNTQTPLEITKEALNPTSETFLNKIIPEDNSLWLLAKNRQILNSQKPLLIFDQFEELFSYEEADINAFKQEIAELLYTGIPLRFRRRLDYLSEDDFSDEQEELIDKDLTPRILFSIRSDRLHLLNQMKNFLPDVLRNCFELKALNPKDAKDAITKPAQMEGNFGSPKFSFADEAVEKLLKFLINNNEPRAEGILIQMLCEHYEKKHVIKEKKLLLTAAEIDEPQNVIINYYDDKISELPQEKQELARLLIEDGLVSEGDNGMRLSFHETYILQEFNVDKVDLESLIDLRLLRSEPFLRGGYTFELSHDRLVPAVIDSRKKRRQKEELEQKEREAQSLREQAEIQKQEKLKAQKQLRTVRGLLFLAIAGLLLAFFGFTYARNQAKIAQKERETALKNEKIAKEKEEEAKQKEKEALNLVQEIQRKEKTIREEKEKTLQALEKRKEEEGLRKAAEEKRKKEEELRKEEEEKRKEEEELRKKEERKNIQIRINNIKALIKVNDRDEAREILNAALKIAPNHPELLNLKKELSN